MSYYLFFCKRIAFELKRDLFQLGTVCAILPGNPQIDAFLTKTSLPKDRL